MSNDSDTTGTTSGAGSAYSSWNSEYNFGF